MRQPSFSKSSGSEKATSVSKISKLAIPDGYKGHPDYTYKQFQDNFFSQWLVSAALPNPETRNMGWGIHRHGYDWFFDNYIMPGIEKGIKNFHIHLPHGGEQGGPMSYDALLEAQEDGDTFAYERFYERISEIYAEHPDVSFLCYFGTFRYDPDIKPLLAPDKIHKWIERCVDSILPAIEAPNIDIGFDASYGPAAEYGPDHPNFHFLSLIRSLKAIQDRRIYGEPKPSQDATWWFDFPVLVTEQYWNRSNPEKHNDTQGAYISDLIGPCLRMETNGYLDSDGNRVIDSLLVPDWRTWFPQRIANVLFKDGQQYGYKFQISHGVHRIIHQADNKASFGPLASSLKEVYELSIEHAVQEGWLSPWKEPPSIEPTTFPELRYENLEDLSE